MLSFFWTGRLTDFVFNSWTWFRSLGRRLLGLPAPFVAAPTSGVSRKNSYRILRRESSVSSLSSITSGTISPRKSASRKHLRKKSSRSLRKASLANDPHLAIKQLLAAPKKKKILVLDLDETLIHSTSKGSKNHDHLIEVLVDKHVCLYYVYKRPHLDYFLKKVSEWYKIVIYTASLPEYADPVIDFMDSRLCVVAKRFFRDSCTPKDASYTKDLTLVDSDLSSIVLVDNSPIAYSLCPDNGIPIDTWTDNPYDECLLDLLVFLDALRYTNDVRSVVSLRRTPSTSAS